MYLFASSGGAGAATGTPSILGAIFPFVLIFVIFYFIIIMPAKKKQKQHQGLITSLKGGERVLTSGGIYGTIARVLEDRFEIQVDNNTKIQVAKSSVSTVIDPTGAEKEAPKK